jgi:hypothetical protein
LRRLAVIYLPACSAEVLNQIPLSGSADNLRAEKFLLGRLSIHKGKLVDELIAESVRDYIARKTFSNTTEIAGLLDWLRFSLDESDKKHLPPIAELLARRHQIVHRADMRYHFCPTK